jgi:AcrR family transcriptional regulator
LFSHRAVPAASPARGRSRGTTGGNPRPGLGPRSATFRAVEALELLAATPERSLEERVAAATGRCLARGGLRRLSVDEVAAEAGVSRATVYRLFPGGKRALVEQAARVEAARFFFCFSSVLEEAGNLEEWLSIGLAAAATALADDAGVRALLVATVEADGPSDPFAGLAQLVRLLAEAAAPYAARYVGPAAAGRVAEWVVRAALSYTTCPSPDYDLRRPGAANALVRDFLLPSLSRFLGKPVDPENRGG